MQCNLLEPTENNPEDEKVQFNMAQSRDLSKIIRILGQLQHGLIKETSSQRGSKQPQDYT